MTHKLDAAQIREIFQQNEELREFYTASYPHKWEEPRVITQLLAACAALMRAREALEEYGVHHSECSCFTDTELGGIASEALPCDCGFRSALAKIPEISLP